MNMSRKRIIKIAACLMLVFGAVTVTAQRKTTKKTPVKSKAKTTTKAKAPAKTAVAPKVAPEINRLLNDSSLRPFFEKVNEVDEVSVLHLGDSHLQAGFFPGVVAERLQEQFGNAGRGFVFPYNVAGTNGPDDPRWTSSSRWQAARVVEKTSMYTGPGGIVLYTQQPSPDLSLTMRGGNFDSAEVLYEGGSLGDAPVKQLPSGLSLATLSFQDGSSNLNLRWSGVQGTRFYGAVLHNGHKGLLYHTVGVNGATFSNYNNMDLSLQVQARWLHPDLVILSLGTNEAFGYISAAQFRAEIDNAVTTLRNSCPEGTVFLLTTPPSGMGKAVRTPYRKKVNGKYKTYYRSRFHTNPHVNVLRNEILDYCKDNGLACWDFYGVMIGDDRFRSGWSNDHLHFNATGYRLQGTLLSEAIIKAYKKYHNL